jgi:hypothetical protein
LTSGQLILKRAPIGWKQEDYDVLSEGEVVGRIQKVTASPTDAPWMWTLAYGHHRDRSPTHGFEARRAEEPYNRQDRGGLWPDALQPTILRGRRDCRRGYRRGSRSSGAACGGNFSTLIKLSRNAQTGGARMTGQRSRPRVEHVHVNDGGQALIENVSSER